MPLTFKPGQLKDISNQRFGRLVPIMPIGRKDKHTVWLFQCDCGKTKAIKATSVVHGKTKSCGCFYIRKQIRQAAIQDALPKNTGRCEICQSETALDIDHDHRCCPQFKMCPKCVRGRLCRRCNNGLGLFDDNIKTLASAIEYLRRFNGLVK